MVGGWAQDGQVAVVPLVLEVWWGEAPDRPVSGCEEFEACRVT
jgi:hypothetical protein